MRNYYWAGILITAASVLSACTTDGKITFECTVKPGESITIDTTVGNEQKDCEAKKAEAKAGKPVSGASPAATVANAPNPLAAAASKTPTTAKQAFATPFVAGSGGSTLISPTDPQKRLEELNSNAKKSKKGDPFAVIPGTIPTPAPPSKIATKPPANSLRDRARIRVAPVKAPNFVPPDPTEAKAVNVSGVVDIAGTQYAIISVPNETTSRYVTAGQRIANNKVLIKRIDAFGTPKVILEQFGIEVIRAVGQTVVASATTSTGTDSATGAAPQSAASNDPNLPPGVIMPPAGDRPTIVPPIVTPAGIPAPANN